MSHIENLTEEIHTVITAQNLSYNQLQDLITEFLRENNLEIFERRRDDRQAWKGLNNA